VISTQELKLNYISQRDNYILRKENRVVGFVGDANDMNLR
jgi:hypothetical protein